jgi:putative membrane protein
MRRIFYSILLAGALFISFTACESKKENDSQEVAEEQNEENLEGDAEDAAEVVTEIADGGMYEVQLATMALTKATSARVKEFAQMMVDDHTKANNELKAMASRKNIILPDVMSEKTQKKYYDLEQKEKGNEFDKKFIDQMVKDHKEDIDSFEDLAEETKDSELQTWASGKLPALKHHLEEAQRIQEELKKAN